MRRCFSRWHDAAIAEASEDGAALSNYIDNGTLNIYVKNSSSHNDIVEYAEIPQSAQAVAPTSPMKSVNFSKNRHSNLQPVLRVN